MLWVIILLEIIIASYIKIISTFLEIILQYVLVELLVHLVIYKYKFPHTRCRHAPPHHYIATPVFYCWLHVLHL